MTIAPLAVAVDWSGRRTDDRGTWVAAAVDGELLDLRPATRAGAVDYLLDAASSRRVLAGLDFCFSFPQWVTELRGEPPDLWRHVADCGEEWLAACAPPFWGRAGTRLPDGVELFRRTETELRAAGWAPKSIFQIGGAGAVGTGSIRGMPHLLRLHEAGFGVWPFTTGDSIAVEMYPRLMTGPVAKRRLDARAAYVSAFGLSPEFADLAVASEDAFDAAISAVVISQHIDEHTALRRAFDPVTRAEGKVWIPAVSG